MIEVASAVSRSVLAPDLLLRRWENDGHLSVNVVFGYKSSYEEVPLMFARQRNIYHRLGIKYGCPSQPSY